MTMTERHLSCLGPSGFHRLAYVQWDEGAGGIPILCVHGLTRNGRDFDQLAARLAARGPVLAPDMPGRGKSAWLGKPAEYGYPLYLGDIAQLIARSGADQIDYVGTSMGGILGMMLAAQPGSPIRRMVINDVGPFIPKASLVRIGASRRLPNSKSICARFTRRSDRCRMPNGRICCASVIARCPMAASLSATIRRSASPIRPS
jgi:pimeloyl-ACP methyl ester carboxylesterase